jgi:hypothetical protein
MADSPLFSVKISHELREIQYKKAVKSLNGLFLKLFQMREITKDIVWKSCKKFYGLFLKLFQMRETKFFLQNVLLQGNIWY